MWGSIPQYDILTTWSNGMILLLHSIYAGSIPAVVIFRDNRLTGKPWHFQCYFACSIHACHILLIYLRLNVVTHGWVCWLQISLFRVQFPQRSFRSRAFFILDIYIYFFDSNISLSRSTTDCCVIGNVSTLGVGIWGFKSLQSDRFFIHFYTYKILDII